jgi:hypothetical protein
MDITHFTDNDDCRDDHDDGYCEFNLQELSQHFIPLLSSLTAKESPAIGLALRLEEPAAPYENHVFIDTITEDGSTLHRLGPFPEEEVSAIWRFFHDVSGLSLMSEEPGGGFYVMTEHLGLAVLGEHRARRRYAFLSGRRPRFLTRRKAGQWSLKPVIRREREILRGGRG